MRPRNSLSAFTATDVEEQGLTVAAHQQTNISVWVSLRKQAALLCYRYCNYIHHISFNPDLESWLTRFPSLDGERKAQICSKMIFTNHIWGRGGWCVGYQHCWGVVGPTPRRADPRASHRCSRLWGLHELPLSSRTTKVEQVTSNLPGTGTSQEGEVGL